MEDQGGEAMEEGDDTEFRLILVGKSGVGKSATGNTILGSRVFNSALAANAITTAFEKEYGSWQGKSISVVDTPAFFDSKEAEKSLEEELENCRRMCRSGLHAFLLVIQVGRFTAEDRAAAKHVRKIFGNESASRTILLFTCKEDLGGESLEKYLEEATNKDLLDLLKRCRHRVCGFNNKAEGREQEEQVSELMEKVEKVIEQSRGKPYFIPRADDAEFRLILVGKSGVGRSATGNTILGKNVFDSIVALNATTTEFKKEYGSWQGKSISVVDTPALFDSKEAEKSLEDELENCRWMCRSGLHAFLLVMQVGRFTAEDRVAAKCVWKIFGDESAGRTILLFTCKEDLGGESLEKYLEEATNKDLRDLLKRCHHRVCGFNNKAEGREREEQVSELMEKVEKVIEESRGKPYFIPQGDDAEFRLILVGKSGVGKSATGNTILGSRAFDSTLAANTTTTAFEKEYGSWQGKSISVVDTPDLFYSKEAEKSLEDELGKCRRMCRSGLHAFLLVIQVGRFTAEDRAAAKRVCKIFGNESVSRTILLFTCKEDLGGESLEKYLEEATNKDLRDLLKRCRHRVCGFNNKAEGREREEQVSELMEMVEKVIEESREKPYFIPRGSEKSNPVSNVLKEKIKKFKIKR